MGKRMLGRMAERKKIPVYNFSYEKDLRLVSKIRGFIPTKGLKILISIYACFLH
jgi:hypothetical protein